MKDTSDPNFRKIKTSNANILESKTSAIVNAGNEVLDRGSYRIGGLSRAIHDDFGYKDAILSRHEESGFYFLKRPSNLADALVINNPDIIEDCLIEVDALNENGRRIGRQPIEIKAHKLKDGEAAIVDLNSIELSEASNSIMKSNNVSFLIHTAGPDCRLDKFNVLSSDSEEEASAKKEARSSALERAYTSSLNKALENGVVKIALPTLSVGIFQYPEKEAAQVIARTLLKFEDRFEEISIVAMDPKNPDVRPTILDLIEQNLLEEKIHPSPSSSTKTVSAFQINSLLSNRSNSNSNSSNSNL